MPGTIPDFPGKSFLIAAFLMMSCVVPAATAAPDDDKPNTPGGGDAPTSSDLVARDRTRLNLAGAERILRGAREKAEALKLNVNIAIVDDGGHLLAFVRMDGARPASIYTALAKASTAATLRQPTGPIPLGAPNPDLLLNLSLQNAAAAGGGKLTTLVGGIPVTVDSQVIGGIGVGGGTGEQDAEIARAGIAALITALESRP